jgi:hypothetical protein
MMIDHNMDLFFFKCTALYGRWYEKFLISSIFDEYIYIIFDNRQAYYQYIYPVKHDCTRYECNIHIVMWKW